MPVTKRPYWILVWLLAASPAAAEQLWLAGAEASAGGGRYAYAGLITPLGEGRLGAGWFQRAWLDWLGYTYDGADGTVRARAPGGEWALGRAWSAGATAAALSAGAVYRDTRLTPAAADSAVAGGRWGLKLQGEARTSRPGWAGEAIASYTVGTAGYWARLRAFRRRGDHHWPGAELVVQGDPEYRAVQVGGVWGRLPAGPSAHFNLKAGLRRDASQGASGYAGVEWVWLP